MRFLLSITSLLVIGCVSKIKKDNPHDYDDRLSENAQVTSDVNLLGKVQGEGNQVELFGLFRFGDNGRANYEDEYNDIFKGNEMIHSSKQSAVYNALEGETDTFLIDPQFRTTINNFLIFKTTKSEVVGQKAIKNNYRQIKRFTTDQTETVPLPHTYTVKRNGKESTSVITSHNLPSHVSDSISVVDTGNSVGSVNISKPINRNLESLESRLQQNRERLLKLQNEYQLGL